MQTVKLSWLEVLFLYYVVVKIYSFMWKMNILRPPATPFRSVAWYKTRLNNLHWCNCSSFFSSITSFLTLKCISVSRRPISSYSSHWSHFSRMDTYQGALCLSFLAPIQPSFLLTWLSSMSLWWPPMYHLLHTKCCLLLAYHLCCILCQVVPSALHIPMWSRACPMVLRRALCCWITSSSLICWGKDLVPAKKKGWYKLEYCFETMFFY